MSAVETFLPSLPGAGAGPGAAELEATAGSAGSDDGAAAGCADSDVAGSCFMTCSASEAGGENEAGSALTSAAI